MFNLKFSLTFPGNARSYQLVDYKCLYYFVKNSHDKIFQYSSEAPDASRCGGGRNRRKGTFMCQSLLLKQIGNRRLA